jgi:hypothetical protein
MIGALISLGWKVNPPKPPTWASSYTKNGKTLQKKGGVWYLDTQKLGRLSDYRLIAKLRIMKESHEGNALSNDELLLIRTVKTHLSRAEHLSYQGLEVDALSELDHAIAAIKALQSMRRRD